VCQRENSNFLEKKSGVDYFQCSICGSIYADRQAIDIGTGGSRVYDATYWRAQVEAARQRCFGGGIIRVAETMLYSRMQVNRFLDISCGTGFLLDAVATLNPALAEQMIGIEPYPPPPEWRSQHPNFRIGHISDLDGVFEAGVCIEVIEHLWPDALRSMLAELAKVSVEGSLYYFNSAQPSFVIKQKLVYLDPFTNGHVVSYSVEGLRSIFADSGFVVHALPGRDWAFLAEYGKRSPESAGELYTRLWKPVPENLSLLRKGTFGSLLRTIGLESARCYLEIGLRAAKSSLVGEQLA
jgi:hypothetical protein